MIMKKRNSTLVRTTLIVLFSVFFPNVHSQEQDWIKVSRDIDGNEYYISSTYVSKGGIYNYDKNIIKLWTKNTWKKLVETRNGKTKTYNNVVSIELMEFDCSEKKYRQISCTIYDSKGNFISSDNFEHFFEWDYAIPDSTGLTVLNMVCNKFN